MRKRFTQILVPALAMLLLGTCSIENPIDTPVGANQNLVNLSLSFPTSKATGNPEFFLDSLRIIIFKSNESGIASGPPLVNKVELPPLPNAEEIEVTVRVPVGFLNIYLIGNEGEEITPHLKAVMNYSDIGAIELDYRNPDLRKPPFTSYSEFKAVKISTTGEITHPEYKSDPTHPVSPKKAFRIARTVTKISITIECNFADIPGLGNRKIVLDSASVVSMPLHPKLVPQMYARAQFFSSKKIAMDTCMVDIIDAFLAITGTKTKPGGFMFYVPEHILNSSVRDNFTYLLIEGRIDNAPTQLIYRVPLGNGLGHPHSAAYLLENYSTVNTADLTLTRNMHYSIELKIMGYGERSHIDVFVVVKPWDMVNIDGSNKDPYIHVSTVSTTVSRFQPQRIFFWTNQKNIDNVQIELKGKIDNTGTDFNVNDYFQNLAGGPTVTNFHFDENSGSGYFDIILSPTYSVPGEIRYLIYLSSSRARREIEIITNYMTISQFNGWLYVKSGTNGDGTSWDRALPTIESAIDMAEAMKSQGFAVFGILVAGGAQRVYPESFIITNNVKIFGGWEGRSGTELDNNINAPYTSSHRNLTLYKAAVIGNIEVTGAGAALDGFSVWGYAGTTHPAVSVSNGAYINAVEITGNAPVTGGAPSNALSVDNAKAVNVLVADNAGGVHLTNGSLLLNGTVVNNRTASVCNNSTMINTIVWSNQFNFTGTNTITHCALPESMMQAGTNNYPIHVNNNAWFTVTNVVPGPHFNLGTKPAAPNYAAASNRAPMMGRGDEGLFDTNTLFMPAGYKTDINGNNRHYEWTDIGCYEDTIFEGFRLRWATDKVYLSSRGGVVNDIPLLLPENEVHQIGVLWEVKVTHVAVQNVWTPPTPSAGSGSGVMVGVLQITTLGPNYVLGPEVYLGTMNIHTNLGAYLPDADFQVWRIPGTSALWEEGYVGSFHRDDETKARWITGENSYATFNGTPSATRATTKNYYSNWEARIVSGLDWIKIDTHPKSYNNYEVVETFGGVVRGTTSPSDRFIRFRVGLKSHNPNPGKPRYGLIIIMRGNDPNNYLGAAWFFVRQGEADDFLYRVEDPHPNNRNFAAKFSPYNLKAPGSVPNGGFNVRSGATSTAAFTQYPTMVGDFFQLNRTWAYRRGVQTSNLPSGTDVPYPNYANREVCPTGYRHPKWGEIIHSLYDALSYISGTGTYAGSLEPMLRGFVWGYYADGYFDQLPGADPVPIDNRGNIFLGSGDQLAGKGMLMVNHYNYASVFFPMPGTMTRTAPTQIGQDFNYIRNPQTNVNPNVFAASLYRRSSTAGVTAMYPASDARGTSAATSTNTHWIAGHVGLSCTPISAAAAVPVRCVKE